MQFNVSISIGINTSARTKAKSGDIGLYQHLSTATDNSRTHQLVILCEFSPQKKAYTVFQQESFKKNSKSPRMENSERVGQKSLYIFIEAQLIVSSPPVEGVPSLPLPVALLFSLGPGKSSRHRSLQLLIILIV